MTLLEFVEHEVLHEYEKAMRCFFQKDKQTQAEDKGYDGN